MNYRWLKKHQDDAYIIIISVFSFTYTLFFLNEDTFSESGYVLLFFGLLSGICVPIVTLLCVVGYKSLVLKNFSHIDVTLFILFILSLPIGWIFYLGVPIWLILIDTPIQGILLIFFILQRIQYSLRNIHKIPQVFLSGILTLVTAVGIALFVNYILLNYFFINQENYIFGLITCVVPIISVVMGRVQLIKH